MKLFSNRQRPFHLGSYPLERLRRADHEPQPLANGRPARPPIRPRPDNGRIAESAYDYLRLFENYCDGEIASRTAPIDSDEQAIAADLKAGGYFLDATMMGTCACPVTAWYGTTPDGVPLEPDHDHAVVVVVEYGLDIEPDNAAYDWTLDSQKERSETRALQIANVIAGYIRNLGWPARAHSRDHGDVCHDRLLIRAGLAETRDGRVVNPFLDTRFASAIVTTTLAMSHDRPLASRRWLDKGLAYWLGSNGAFPELTRRWQRSRRTDLSRYPMERIKRVDCPTSLILDEEVPRVSKRAAFFERGLRGDLGEKSQKERTRFAVKHPFTFAMRKMQAAMVPLQDGPVAPEPAPGTADPDKNARAIKSLSYWMGTDLTGICRVPDYAWFSHKEDGTPIDPYHRNAIVLLIDQGFETMEGASGDDWISGSQSMRGYMRGAEITGIMADHIRRLGWSARAHTNIDSEVLHIPLILLAGLGELSRIGELVLNPYVGPRFKSAVITTDMPLTADKPIDFGLQDMCRKCMKCARECPCDAISWGETVMFNGYEMWKPDVERCARYRLTNPKGAACGRCMKTCPYNHEGLLYHRFFLWLAIKVPALRGRIAKLDDQVGNGRRNLVKKWWQDLEWLPEGYAVAPRKGTNQRDLDREKILDPAKQKIAYYPANAMPVPNDTNPSTVNKLDGSEIWVIVRSESRPEFRARVSSTI